jgi:hypothetical protein
VLHTFHSDDAFNPTATPLFGRQQTIFASAIFGGPTQDGTTIALKLKPNIPVANLTFSPNPVQGARPLLPL